MTKEPKPKRVTRYVVAKSHESAQLNWSGRCMSFTTKPRAYKELERWPKEDFPNLKVFKAVMTIEEAKP